MKCRRCDRKAVINMRHHKLALCKDHYLEWLPEQVERSIQRYRMFGKDARILVAVSGGKDSLSLWDILWRLGYSTTGLYIGLGINDGYRGSGAGYSDESQRLTEAFALERGLPLQVVGIPETYGETIPVMADRTHRGKTKPCAVCGMTKRHVMNRIGRDQGFDVLVTGHNLDDEAAVLFGNTLNWLTGYLARQGPLLEADRPGLARKAKPLCRIYEREMAAYAVLRGIEYIYEECPFAYGSRTIYYKELLNKMEDDNPGAKLNFYLSFLQAKEKGLFTTSTEGELANLHECHSCGQPTTAPGLCAFCRMISQVTGPAAEEERQ